MCLRNVGSSVRMSVLGIIPFPCERTYNEVPNIRFWDHQVKSVGMSANRKHKETRMKAHLSPAPTRVVRIPATDVSAARCAAPRVRKAAIRQLFTVAPSVRVAEAAMEKKIELKNRTFMRWLLKCGGRQRRRLLLRELRSDLINNGLPRLQLRDALRQLAQQAVVCVERLTDVEINLHTKRRIVADGDDCASYMQKRYIKCDENRDCNEQRENMNKERHKFEKGQESNMHNCLPIKKVNSLKREHGLNDHHYMVEKSIGRAKFKKFKDGTETELNKYEKSTHTKTEKYFCVKNNIKNVEKNSDSKYENANCYYTTPLTKERQDCLVSKRTSDAKCNIVRDSSLKEEKHRKSSNQDKTIFPALSAENIVTLKASERETEYVSNTNCDSFGFNMLKPGIYKISNGTKVNEHNVARVTSTSKIINEKLSRDEGMTELSNESDSLHGLSSTSSIMGEKSVYAYSSTESLTSSQRNKLSVQMRSLPIETLGTEAVKSPNVHEDGNCSPSKGEAVAKKSTDTNVDQYAVITAASDLKVMTNEVESLTAVRGPKSGAVSSRTTELRRGNSHTLSDKLINDTDVHKSSSEAPINEQISSRNRQEFRDKEGNALMLDQESIEPHLKLKVEAECDREKSKSSMHLPFTSENHNSVKSQGFLLDEHSKNLHENVLFNHNITEDHSDVLNKVDLASSSRLRNGDSSARSFLLKPSSANDKDVSRNNRHRLSVENEVNDIATYELKDTVMNSVQSKKTAVASSVTETSIEKQNQMSQSVVSGSTNSQSATTKKSNCSADNLVNPQISDTSYEVKLKDRTICSPTEKNKIFTHTTISETKKEQLRLTPVFRQAPCDIGNSPRKHHIHTESNKKKESTMSSETSISSDTEGQHMNNGNNLEHEVVLTKDHCVKHTACKTKISSKTEAETSLKRPRVREEHETDHQGKRLKETSRASGSYKRKSKLSLKLEELFGADECDDDDINRGQKTAPQMSKTQNIPEVEKEIPTAGKKSVDLPTIKQCSGEPQSSKKVVEKSSLLVSNKTKTPCSMPKGFVPKPKLKQKIEQSLISGVSIIGDTEKAVTGNSEDSERSKSAKEKVMQNWFSDVTNPPACSKSRLMEKDSVVTPHNPHNIPWQLKKVDLPSVTIKSKKHYFRQSSSESYKLVVGKVGKHKRNSFPPVPNKSAIMDEQTIVTNDSILSSSVQGRRHSDAAFNGMNVNVAFNGMNVNVKIERPNDSCESVLPLQTNVSKKIGTLQRDVEGERNICTSNESSTSAISHESNSLHDENGNAKNVEVFLTSVVVKDEERIFDQNEVLAADHNHADTSELDPLNSSFGSTSDKVVTESTSPVESSSSHASVSGSGGNLESLQEGDAGKGIAENLKESVTAEILCTEIGNVVCTKETKQTSHAEQEVHSIIHTVNEGQGPNESSPVNTEAGPEVSVSADETKQTLPAGQEIHPAVHTVNEGQGQNESSVAHTETGPGISVSTDKTKQTLHAGQEIHSIIHTVNEGQTAINESSAVSAEEEPKDTDTLKNSNNISVETNNKTAIENVSVVNNALGTEPGINKDKLENTRCNTQLGENRLQCDDAEAVPCVDTVISSSSLENKIGSIRVKDPLTLGIDLKRFDSDSTTRNVENYVNLFPSEIQNDLSDLTSLFVTGFMDIDRYKARINDAEKLPGTSREIELTCAHKDFVLSIESKWRVVINKVNFLRIYFGDKFQLILHTFVNKRRPCTIRELSQLYQTFVKQQQNSYAQDEKIKAISNKEDGNTAPFKSQSYVCEVENSPKQKALSSANFATNALTDKSKSINNPSEDLNDARKFPAHHIFNSEQGSLNNVCQGNSTLQPATVSSVKSIQGENASERDSVPSQIARNDIDVLTASPRYSPSNGKALPCTSNLNENVLTRTYTVQNTQHQPESLQSLTSLVQLVSASYQTRVVGRLPEHSQDQTRHSFPPSSQPQLGSLQQEQPLMQSQPGCQLPRQLPMLMQPQPGWQPSRQPQPQPQPGCQPSRQPQPQPGCQPSRQPQPGCQPSKQQQPQPGYQPLRQQQQQQQQQQPQPGYQPSRQQQQQQPQPGYQPSRQQQPQPEYQPSRQSQPQPHPRWQPQHQSGCQPSSQLQSGCQPPRQPQPQLQQSGCQPPRQPQLQSGCQLPRPPQLPLQPWCPTLGQLQPQSQPRCPPPEYVSQGQLQRGCVSSNQQQHGHVSSGQGQIGPISPKLRQALIRYPSCSTGSALTSNPSQLQDSYLLPHTSQPAVGCPPPYPSYMRAGPHPSYQNAGLMDKQRSQQDSYLPPNQSQLPSYQIRQQYGSLISSQSCYITNSVTQGQVVNGYQSSSQSFPSSQTLSQAGNVPANQSVNSNSVQTGYIHLEQTQFGCMSSNSKQPHFESSHANNSQIRQVHQVPSCVTQSQTAHRPGNQENMNHQLLSQAFPQPASHSTTQVSQVSSAQAKANQFVYQGKLRHIASKFEQTQPTASTLTQDPKLQSYKVQDGKVSSNLTNSVIVGHTRTDRGMTNRIPSQQISADAHSSKVVPGSRLVRAKCVTVQDKTAITSLPSTTRNTFQSSPNVTVNRQVCSQLQGRLESLGTEMLFHSYTSTSNVEKQVNSASCTTAAQNCGVKETPFLAHGRQSENQQESRQQIEHQGHKTPSATQSIRATNSGSQQNIASTSNVQVMGVHQQTINSGAQIRDVPATQCGSIVQSASNVTAECPNAGVFSPQTANSTIVNLQVQRSYGAAAVCEVPNSSLSVIRKTVSQSIVAGSSGEPSQRQAHVSRHHSNILNKQSLSKKDLLTCVSNEASANQSGVLSENNKVPSSSSVPSLQKAATSQSLSETQLTLMDLLRSAPAVSVTRVGSMEKQTDVIGADKDQHASNVLAPLTVVANNSKASSPSVRAQADKVSPQIYAKTAITPALSEMEIMKSNGTSCQPVSTESLVPQDCTAHSLSVNGGSSSNANSVNEGDLLCSLEQPGRHNVSHATVEQPHVPLLTQCDRHTGKSPVIVKDASMPLTSNDGNCFLTTDSEQNAVQPKVHASSGDIPCSLQTLGDCETPSNRMGSSSSKSVVYNSNNLSYGSASLPDTPVAMNCKNKAGSELLLSEAHTTRSSTVSLNIALNSPTNTTSPANGTETNNSSMTEKQSDATPGIFNSRESESCKHLAHNQSEVILKEQENLHCDSEIMHRVVGGSTSTVRVETVSDTGANKYLVPKSDEAPQESSTQITEDFDNIYFPTTNAVDCNEEISSYKNDFAAVDDMDEVDVKEFIASDLSVNSEMSIKLMSHVCFDKKELDLDSSDLEINEETECHSEALPAEVNIVSKNIEIPLEKETGMNIYAHAMAASVDSSLNSDSEVVTPGCGTGKESSSVTEKREKTMSKSRTHLTVNCRKSQSCDLDILDVERTGEKCLIEDDEVEIIEDYSPVQFIGYKFAKDGAVSKTSSGNQHTCGKAALESFSKQVSPKSADFDSVQKIKETIDVNSSEETTSKDDNKECSESVCPRIISVVSLTSGATAESESQWLSSPEPRTVSRDSGYTTPSDGAAHDAQEIHVDGEINCAFCENTAQILCTGCFITCYCSADCQAKHWREVHYEECKLQNAGGMNQAHSC